MERYLRDIIRQKIVDASAVPLPALTHRDAYVPAIPHKATAVIGMRRSGKTSFLWQLLAQKHAAGVSREGLLYFSFEDERLAGMTVQQLDWLLQEYYRLFPAWRDGRRAAFFLDEIQVVPGWEAFARRMLDSENVDLYVSGSSARMLSREIATSLRGRSLEVVIYPFSFREVLRHRGLEPTTPPAHWKKAERSALEHQLLDYLRAGGFPEAQGLVLRDRLELLRGYVDVVLLRDIIERHAVSQPLALRWLVRQLLGNAAGTFSINKFHGDLKSQGMAIGKETLHAFLGHLEDAFLIRVVSLATESERRRMVNPRKVYPIDPGLIPVFDRTGKANVGHALEAAVLLELERRGAEVSYVITPAGFEVDFLARYPGGEEELIQVCASLDDPATAAREWRALADAQALYPKAASTLIALDIPADAAVPAGMSLQRAPDWLLLVRPDHSV